MGMLVPHSQFMSKTSIAHKLRSPFLQSARGSGLENLRGPIKLLNESNGNHMSQHPAESQRLLSHSSPSGLAR
jgi:hypothetical protein